MTIKVGDKLPDAKLTQATAVSIEPGTSPEHIRARVTAAVHAVDTGEGVLLFADIIGGTPCNQSLALCRVERLEVLSGVNLPMLLKANTLRQAVPSLPELAGQLAAYGQKSITCVSELLRSQLAATGR